MKKNNNMNVEIDPETADGIVRASLNQTIEYLREDITVLKKTRKLQDYQKRDLAELVVALNAMEEVFDYYGGNLK
jgi:alkylation response protein AidB-like acyl-CoA dehydrogenase